VRSAGKGGHAFALKGVTIEGRGNVLVVQVVSRQNPNLTCDILPWSGITWRAWVSDPSVAILYV